MARVGLQGLELNKPIDALDPTELARWVNMVHTGGGDISTRPGQTLLLTVAGTHHTLARLNRIRDGQFTRFVGSGGMLYRGQSGSIPAIYSGFSGDPLITLAHRPALSGDPWLYVADRNKMAKASIDNAFERAIGHPAPPVAAAAAIGAVYTTNISGFEVGDGTQASHWTPSSWFDQSSTPITTGIGAASDIGNAVRFTTAPGNSQVGYGNVFGIPFSTLRDLSKLQGGAIIATDDDLVHMAIKVDHPAWVSEIRVYFVVSGGFVPNVLPGTNDSLNTDAYVKAFKSDSFQSFVEVVASADTAGAVALGQKIQDDYLDSQAGLGQQLADRMAIGRNAWTTFGTLDTPLHRGDFERIGTDVTARNWSTVTGMVILILTNTNKAVNVTFDDCYLTGGAGLDSSGVKSPYDWRYTQFDLVTWTESNPSPVMATTLDVLRQPVNVAVRGSGISTFRQRVYRRGGSLTGDWFLVGQNGADGAMFQDVATDDSISASGTLNIDHDQPVTTQDVSGNTILAQPIPAIWGPVSGIIIGCGDPYRPGHVYWSKPNEPDHWPANNNVEVCSPTEELMHGCVYSGQAYVFSRERLYALYPNLVSGQGIIATPTTCTEGLVSRWGLAVGMGGIYFVSKDGVRVTTGGESALISDSLRPLFHATARFGLNPIDLTAATAINLTVHDGDLWFQYQDSQGAINTLVYSILYKYWRSYSFANTVRRVFSETLGTGGLQLLMAGVGKTYLHAGFTDDGTPIQQRFRTGGWNFDQPRDQKLLGDVIIDGDFGASTLTMQTLLDGETISNASQQRTTHAGRDRYIFDAFGTTPQKALNVSLDASWVAPSTQASEVEYVGVSFLLQPDVTFNRMTAWEDLGESEAYLWGMFIDSDTGGITRSFVVEYDLGGVTASIGPFTLASSGRHKQWLSWPAVHGNLVRIRPPGTTDNWIVYKVEWITKAEPPRLALWDSTIADLGDSYYTGLDIECDTLGATKSIQVLVDGVVQGTYNIAASGRRHIHVTLNPPGRGHVFQFVATDANPGLLYNHKWIVEEEPLEQANWNQNFTIAGTMSDKWLKGIMLECDTFGQDKLVNVEVDGTVVQTLTVNTSGRRIVTPTFVQSLGRVFRILPTDAHPGRLYSMGWIFDEEPLALTRYETQELDHGIRTWQIPLEANVTLRSSSVVTLTMTTYDQSGVASPFTYNIPSTGGAKRKVYVPFNASKGVLFKYVFTSSQPFWLYREESNVLVQAWGGDLLDRHPFGNDDLDLVRGMHSASMTATRGGGGSSTRGGGIQ